MQKIKSVPINKITDPHAPMRLKAQDESLFGLADDIKRNGLINPITIRPVGDSYEVVAGHRRFLACKLAGFADIDCVIRDLSDDEVFSVMVAENLSRVDVSPVEQALFFGKYIDQNQSSTAEAAARLGRSEEFIQSRLDVLTYPDYLIELLQRNHRMLGVCEWLARIEDDFWRRQYADMAEKQGMSVLQARYLHDQWKMGITAPAETLLEDAAQVAHKVPQKARATCAACHKEAEDPNLQLLYCHKECPADSEQEGSVKE